jgi:hypothetical protein
VAAADFFRQLGGTVVELPGATREQLVQAAADYRRARELSGELFRANRNSTVYADKHIGALINGAAACSRLLTSDPSLAIEAADSYREYLAITDPRSGSRPGEPYLRAFALKFVAGHPSPNAQSDRPSRIECLHQALAELDGAKRTSPQYSALRARIQADLDQATGDGGNTSRQAPER